MVPFQTGLSYYIAGGFFLGGDGLNTVASALQAPWRLCCFLLQWAPVRFPNCWPKQIHETSDFAPMKIAKERICGFWFGTSQVNTHHKHQPQFWVASEWKQCSQDRSSFGLRMTDTAIAMPWVLAPFKKFQEAGYPMATQKKYQPAGVG